jgi:CheY-like chemotaxis protein
VVLKKSAADLRDVIAKAIEIASPLLEERRHYLDVRLPKTSIRLSVDEGRMVQVFANLLTNAAKYTEPGGHIVVEVRAGEGSTVVEVRDDGMGIAPEMLPTLFDQFVQGNQSIDRSQGGLGIGLSLVRSLVHLHGGSVEARSDGPGRGSCFTVALPLAAVLPLETPEAEPISPVHAKNGQRILVVDDNLDALHLLADLLRLPGHEVRTASDGAQALETIQQFTPDVAVLDIGLPVIDGYELATRLRSQLADKPLTLIALTGYGQRHDQERSRRAGFDHHLVKPVDAQTLLELVHGL